MYGKKLIVLFIFHIKIIEEYMKRLVKRLSSVTQLKQILDQVVTTDIKAFLLGPMVRDNRINSLLNPSDRYR